MQEIRAVVFDWDGTLVDSFAATRHASMAVFRHFGVRMDEERYRATYQPDWHATYREVGIPEDRWEQANDVWQHHYREQIAQVHLFRGVREALADLAAAGIRLGVVTSADRARLLADIERFRLKGRFGALVAFEDARRQKPHPDGLVRALEGLGVPAARTLHVGDRPEDVLMGKRAGTRTAGVPSAYGPRSLLVDAGPDLMVNGAGLVAAALSVPRTEQS